ncbi:glycosyltransferase family 4 protein [Haloferax larsenii]|uniref:Glycosyltransferase involved in cell wall bisynthesis n=1 Tax=Haloferax larsenii TaxID=302484 RepID=A0A1H7V013_HALLR|nr:glycosyltransferase family 4 protein [Haloferax larsenii]SEM02456.1 Glycosyltransferase involved in cell wall bisynthesis [Haloferax larsenii]
MRVLTFGETSGQAWNMARSVDRHGIEVDVVTAKPHRYNYPSNRVIDNPPSTLLEKYYKRSIEFRNWLKDYDVINYWFASTLFPGDLDLRILDKTDTKIIITFRGSDARINRIAESKNIYYSRDIQPKSDAKQTKRLRSLSKYADLAVVGYPELEQYVKPFFEDVVCVPRSIDVEKHNPKYTKNKDSGLTIVHAPSDKNKKGTNSILNGVEKYTSSRDINFRLLESVENEELVQVMRNSDILIDQIRLGTFGVVSLEAMANGTPAMAYIHEDYVRKPVTDIPIINTNPDTITSDIARILSDEIDLHRIAKASRKYVEQNHSLSSVGDKWARVYRGVVDNV